MLSNPILIALLEDMRRKNKGADEDSQERTPITNIPVGKNKGEKTPADWFKEHMVSSEHDDEKRKALEG